MLKPDKDPGILEMTTLVAKEAIPLGNIFLTKRHELGPSFEDEQFRELCKCAVRPNRTLSQAFETIPGLGQLIALARLIRIQVNMDISRTSK